MKSKISHAYVNITVARIASELQSRIKRDRDREGQVLTFDLSIDKHGEIIHKIGSGRNYVRVGQPREILIDVHDALHNFLNRNAMNISVRRASGKSRPSEYTMNAEAKEARIKAWAIQIMECDPSELPDLLVAFEREVCEPVSHYIEVATLPTDEIPDYVDTFYPVWSLSGEDLLTGWSANGYETMTLEEYRDEHNLDEDGNPIDEDDEEDEE